MTVGARTSPDGGASNTNGSKLTTSRGAPSTLTTKSSFVSPRTGHPFSSTTTASTVISSTPDEKTGGGGASAATAVVAIPLTMTAAITVRTRRPPTIPAPFDGVPRRGSEQLACRKNTAI